jgi:tetratricopeptide (TPR) repeat protein
MISQTKIPILLITILTCSIALAAREKAENSWELMTGKKAQARLSKASHSAFFLPTGKQTDELSRVRKILQQALEAARAVRRDEAGEAKPVILARIAETQARAGDHPGAELTFREALHLHSLSPRKGNRPNLFSLWEIAEAQARAGDQAAAARTLKEALRDAAGIQDNVFKAHVLQRIAKAQAKTGNVNDALKTAAAIKKLGQAMPSALGDIAFAQAEQEYVKRALETASRIEDENRKNLVLRHIAVIQAKRDDVSGARQTLETITDDRAKVHAWAEIARAQARAGDIEDAFRTAAPIEWAVLRTDVFRTIAHAQAKTGDRAGAATTFEQALRTASAIKDGHRAKADAYRDIARAQAGVGDHAAAAKTFQRALKAAAAIRFDKWKKAGAFSNIGLAQAEVGDLAGALQTAARIDKMKVKAPALTAKMRSKARVLTAIAEAQTKGGDRAASTKTFGQARRAAYAIRFVPLLRQDERAAALSEISQAQARAGDVSGVLAWIADETSSYVKSLALLSAAKGLLDRIEVKKSQGTNEK